MPASIGVNLRVTGHCSQGGRKYMEDLFSVAYQQTEDERDLEYAFFGIYDGHGGSEAAAFAKEHLMDSIVKQRQFWSDNDDDVLKAIRNGYMLTHMHMWREIDKWPKTVTGLPSTAGTTASVAFIRAGKIYIGHVGDSAIVLGYQKDDCEEWGARPLTVDHKPESAAELHRIHQAGGKVIAKAGVPRVVWNRPQAGHKGPMKQNTPVDEIPFLAVARSLGDLWSYNIYNDEFIVSPDPDVGVLTIDPAKFRCLIFGTDGLWNMVSPETAVALVQGTERHNEAAVVAGGAQPRDWLNPSKSLVDSALERWSGARLRADNTSVVTLMLDPPGPPRAAVLRSRRPNAPMCAKTNSQVIDNESTSGRHFSNSEQPARPRDEVPRKVNLAPNTSSKSVPESSGPAHVTLCVPRATPAAPAARTPLPPCASLDNRFSTVNTGQRLLDQTHEPPEQQGAQDEPEPMSNYGDPHTSQFIVRLLTKREVTNTLFNVYEEIANSSTETTVYEEEEDAVEEVDEMSSATNPVVDTPVRMAATLQTERPPEEEKAVCSTSAVITEDKISEDTPEMKETNEGEMRAASPTHKSIQINEVSSSSPVDSPPKAKARKTKSQSKPNFQAQNQNGRSLRSHDTGEALRRPHTRNGNSTRANKVESKEESRVVPVIHSHAKTATTPERVVILNKPKGVPAPVIVKVQQVKADVKNNMRKLCKSLEPKVSMERPAQKESKQNEVNAHTPIRVTRSKDSNTPADGQKVPMNAKVPTELIQPILPSQSGSCHIPSPENNGDRQPIVIVNNGTSREDFTPHQPVKTYTANHRGRNSKMSDNNHESSKENFIGHPAEDRGPPGSERRRSAKRRPAGEAFLDQEPKEKRRTRLDDKKQSPQSHPQDGGYSLGLDVAQLTGRGGQSDVPQSSTQTVSTSPQSKSSRKSHKFRSTEDRVTVVDSSTTSSEDANRLARQEMHLLSEGSVAPRVMRSRNECAPSLTVSKQKASTHKDCNGNNEAICDEAAKRVLRSSDNTQHRLAEHYEVKIDHLQSPRVALRSKIVQGTGKDCLQKASSVSNKGEEMCRVTRSAATPHATPAKRIAGALNMAKRLSGRSAVQTLTPRNRLRKRLSK